MRGQVDQQPSGEFTPTASTKGTSNATLQADAKFTKIRIRPWIGSQSFQQGTPSLQQTELQG